MKKIITFFILFCFWGCTKTVYIPTQTKAETIYKDTTIYLKDTIKVYLPPEEKENQIMADSSHLETRYAASDAWIDGDNFLHHTLKQKVKEPLPVKVDTFFKVQYVDKYVEVPVIQEVEVEIPYIPKFAWFCIIFTIGVIVYIIVKIWLKFKVV